MADELRLTRSERLDAGTFGRLVIPTKSRDHTFFTVEDDWLDNRVRQSCIPSGIYLLRRTIYYKHGYETFEVTDVPMRSRILIHPANTEEDLEGCIGLGLRRGKLVVPVDEDTGRANVEKDAVVGSKVAFHQFMELMQHVDEAPFIVEWAEGLP